MTPEETFEQNVLFEVLETAIPLWEIAAEASRLGDDLDSAAKIAKARELIQRLRQQGWVELFETQYLGDDIAAPPMTPVEPSRITAVLADPKVWDYETVGNSRTRYVVYGTDRGSREFKDRLRREQWWREGIQP